MITSIIGSTLVPMIGSFLVDHIIPEEITGAIISAIGGVFYSLMIALSYITAFLLPFVS
ncbi:MAG: hypothetical protein J6A67_02785 [Clostridia bacterium]|nr:hypothetical protein [Clostridia bacterium]